MLVPLFSATTKDSGRCRVCLQWSYGLEQWLRDATANKPAGRHLMRNSNGKTVKSCLRSCWPLVSARACAVARFSGALCWARFKPEAGRLLQLWRVEFKLDMDGHFFLLSICLPICRGLISLSFLSLCQSPGKVKVQANASTFLLREQGAENRVSTKGSGDP